MSTPEPALTFDAYLDRLRGESARFRAVLTDADPALRVPGCPDWNAADLLWHLGGVQHLWASIVARRPQGPEALREPERPESYDELLAFFDEASAALVSALGSADPAEAAWTWSTEQTVGFSYRRQAHEALIHRLDAEQATGTVTPLDATLAADGVAEALGVMFGGCPPWGTFTPDGTEVLVEITDTGDRVAVVLGRFTGTDPDDDTSYDEDDLAVIEALSGEAAAVVSGSAADLDAWMWQRGDDTGITSLGDRTAYDRFRTVLAQPIN